MILFESNKNFDVFININLKDETINIPTDKSLIKWCKNIHKNSSLRLPLIKNFIISLHNKYYQNILSYLKLIRDTTENKATLTMKFQEIYILIIKYFTKYHKICIKNETERNEYDDNEYNDNTDSYHRFANYLFDIPYYNKIHILIALIHYLYADENKINKEYLEYEYIDLNLYNKINDYLNDINTLDCRPFDVLYKKAKYPINSKIGCFKLARYNIDYEKLKYIYFNNWEFYSYFSLIWRERFNKYDINIDEEKKEIIFKNDEEYELFYNTFYYETDEQSTKIQDYSIIKINKITPQDWLDLNNIPYILNL